ncbi:IGFBP domain-containing protein [Cololabis saira]|uniref:IGFBP domain-containing protein n=1 Tax=Cololabis saira TaxID=129043 RepID=UPI002AD4F012|nr:IGFBP domain-containing protein [Cololabis saira]
MWRLLFLCAWVGSLGSELESEPGSSGADARQLRALHCPPCSRIHCSPRRAPRLRCRGGVTTGVCGCCPACARTEGEACGGAWDHLGKCDDGLVCEQQDSDADAEAESSGTCRTVMDPPAPESCHPDCTREFCQAHPSALCSARLVSVGSGACRGSCQHTSCSSCLLLRFPACTFTCGPAQSGCLQRFGRCVHQHAECHNDLQSETGGHFVCLVPDCPPHPEVVHPRREETGTSPG